MSLKNTYILFTLAFLCFALAKLNAQIHVFNPDSVTKGRGLYETWDSGFAKNEWTKDCDDWRIRNYEGNPEPAAYFHSDTNIFNYSHKLKSKDVFLSGVGGNGLVHRFQFDYKIEDLSSSGTEQVIIKLYNWGDLYFQDTIINNGSTDWLHYNRFMPLTCFYGVVEFIAQGESSSNIYSWIIDNIKYELCSPIPSLLAAEVGMTIQGDLVNLSWIIDLFPPGYPKELIYDDGTFEKGFASTNGGYGLATLFNMDNFPNIGYHFSINQIQYFNDDYGSPQQEELVYILNGEGDEILFGPYSVVNAPSEEWVTINVDPPVHIISDNFMIATINAEADGPFVGVDDSFYNNSLYFGKIGEWTELSELGAYYYVGSHRAYVWNWGNWKPPVKYNIYRKFPGEDFVKINTTLIDTCEYTDTIPHNAVCTYYVTGVYDDNGCESDSSENIIIDPFVDIENNVAVFRELNISPNPANDKVEVSLRKQISGSYKIILYDISGRKVKSQKYTSKKAAVLNLSDIENGLYIIELQTKDETYSGKLIVSH